MYPWRIYLDYALHVLLAKTRHGTHSPFVYRLLDEVVYSRRQLGEPQDKVARLTARLINWFKPGEVYVFSGVRPADPLDFAISQEYDAEKLTAQLQTVWPMFRSNSVLVVEGIYRNGGMKRLWKAICAKSEVIVAIDLFHVGLVFFRSGQAKENFKIRF